MISIRQETKKDWKDTETVAREAFWDLYRPGCVEHLMVHRLHKDKSYEPDFSFAALEDSQMIGEILVSRALLSGKAAQRRVISIASLAVLPDWQGKGAGRRLIHEVLKKSQNADIDAVTITGKPSYFRPFGFRPAASFHLSYEGLEGDVIPFFMVRVFHKDLNYEGTYHENPCMAVTVKEADAFDQRFPPKEKHILDAQLL